MNKDGYSDKTAEIAVARVMREWRKENGRTEKSTYMVRNDGRGARGTSVKKVQDTGSKSETKKSDNRN
jgi:hypothetical protein